MSTDPNMHQRKIDSIKNSFFYKAYQRIEAITQSDPTDYLPDNPFKAFVPCMVVPGVIVGAVTMPFLIGANGVFVGIVVGTACGMVDSAIGVMSINTYIALGPICFESLHIRSQNHLEKMDDEAKKLEENFPKLQMKPI